ncbi:hypothetical protein H6G25_18540 [Dolichospermum sp. FACHB-1091]|uniref:hypothetical protein n=1 Tax=Dolichospermum sp. FACHB-1091 TaxID=2692798 RepID=UPI001680A3AD|nr:hypothetical protein [Dolichospermum sp. FACHB-1091]MBD2445143.1 hypothetical protein [Dolichospermum sp. FACHB-1091]
MTTVQPKPERVGILLVHGIGKTKKFENIEAVARNIAAALKSDSNLAVRAMICSSDDAEYGATQQTWLANEKKIAPVVIEVKEYDPDDSSKVIKITELSFREVWWSDIGKSDSFQFQLSFWKWGLSLWSRKQYLGKKDQQKQDKEDFSEEDFGTLTKMALPKNVSKDAIPNITWFDRLRFFVVSWIVFLILPLLSFSSGILSRIFGIEVPSDILAQYLGDIKNYQEQKREGAGYLIDIGQPQRVSVRRRMITGLVKMGLANYDRWYVLSHSLGTVVAFNGLMESDAALPNYLNQDLWEEVRNDGMRTTTDQENSLSQKQADNMFPSRPAWLELNNIIAREDLFKNLKGFMTYGSPLSKFAVVWPAIVPINRDNSVFSKDFEWINVYDPTDPVADKTKYFDLENYQGKKTIEIAYKAELIHLLSHIEYLTYHPKRKNPLVKQVATWLLRGGNFELVKEKSWGWPDNTCIRIYQFIRYIIWFWLGLLVAGILDFFVSTKLLKLMEDSKLIQGDDKITYLDISNPLLYVVLAGIIVFFVGIVARLQKDRS